jgi:hypothetical protein
MAVAMMGGLTGATVLTLFFLPALYAAWFRIRPSRRDDDALTTPGEAIPARAPAPAMQAAE